MGYNKAICMRDCFNCSEPYKVSSQRWCYDSKIDYLFKNPLINKKQQKKNPHTDINELGYTFEVDGFTACKYYSLSGDSLEVAISNANEVLYRQVIEAVIDNQGYKHTKPQKRIAYSSILSVRLLKNNEKRVKTC